MTAPTPYYSADGIELYQGDNREVLPALIAAGVYRVEDVALLWGDPPYGIGLDTTARDDHLDDFEPVAGDDKPFDPGPWLHYRRIIFWGANHYASRLPDMKGWICWDKATRNDLDLRQAEFELAWTNFLARPKGFRHLWSGAYRASEQGSRLHPTQKPVALARWGFERAKLEPRDLVLSPWLGSGGEAVAARDAGCRFIGVELVPEYLDACVARLRQRTMFAVPARPPPPEQVELLKDKAPA